MSVNKLGPNHLYSTVQSFFVRLNLTHLGCHKLGRTTERTRRTTIPHLFLAQTVIGNLDMTVERQQDIIQFEVSVDDTIFVKILQRQANLGGVESMSGMSGLVYNNQPTPKTRTETPEFHLLCSLGPELTTLNVKHQVTTTDVLHDKVYSSLRLKTGVQV